MKSKRGQGLPMNTIVIAAIVLIVLVVLIMIFTGSMGKWLEDLKTARESKNCEDLKGTAGLSGVWRDGPTCPDNYNQAYNVKNADAHPGQVCCLRKKSPE